MGGKVGGRERNGGYWWELKGVGGVGVRGGQVSGVGYRLVFSGGVGG